MSHGVLDRRLGTSSKDAKCSTCELILFHCKVVFGTLINHYCIAGGKGLVDCVGHFGYVDLELPVFHCGYFGMILNILQCVCKVYNEIFAYYAEYLLTYCCGFSLQNCSSLLLKPVDMERFRPLITRPNLSYLAKKAFRKKILVQCKKMHVCLNCGSLNGVVKKCGMLKICHDKYRYAKNGEQVKKFNREFSLSILILK